ncbi:UNVERIFIED_CONTAM: hypothetical protein Slati_0946900 [Sesamum latifolium]|uniref:DUF4218 domain-containing protein n=1 Tax=Sesamum latifolium TaxID=2727402 RepID=A0AAW2XT16_9LAMI
MVFYAAGPSYFSSSHDSVPDDGTRSCPIDADHSKYCYGGGLYDYESGLAAHFANIVHAADQPLWRSCTQPCTQSQLGVVAELVDIKADGHILERIYDRISQWDNRILPSGHTLPGDYYHNEEVQAHSRTGPTPEEVPYAVLRYLPLIPRLQRLYCSRSTAEHMTWHATHQTEEGSNVIHLMPRRGDILTWYILILQKSRVIFGLAFAQIVLHHTNVRPCHRQRIHHAGGVDVDCERPNRLWNDVWMSTAGVMGCLVCMDDTRAFHLQHGRKACYFDCHRQFLPEQHLYRRNKKAFTKNHVDNKVARPRLSEDQILDWVADINPAVQILLFLPEGYGAEDERVCEWIKGLLFPDAYSSNLARCVETMELRMHGIKSHDCHVFMQKLILIAFREMLSEHVQSALIEVSLSFQSICSTTLDVHKLHELENTVAITLCNLEKIFPPVFFDSMEHLIVHLPCEARIGRQCNTCGCTHLKGVQSKLTMARRIDERTTMTQAFRSYFELYQHHHSGDPIIDQLVSTEFNDWFKQRDASTSRSQVRQTDDDNKDDDEDSFEDDDTDDDEYELT